MADDELIPRQWTGVIRTADDANHVAYIIPTGTADDAATPGEPRLPDAPARDRRRPQRGDDAELAGFARRHPRLCRGEYRGRALPSPAFIGAAGSHDGPIDQSR